MSFSKKTWVDRVAESPLRRFLTIIRPDDGTGTLVADIERDEGTITTEGDAFSAENMNDLEDRIAEAFDNVTIEVDSSLSTTSKNPVQNKVITTQLNTLNSAVTNKANKVDLTNISITGSTNNTGATISSGTFFYKDGVLVKAKTSIANGATLTLNTNYEVVTAGGLNDLNASLTNLSASFTQLAIFKSDKISESGNLSAYNEIVIVLAYGSLRKYTYIGKGTIITDRYVQLYLIDSVPVVANVVISSNYYGINNLIINNQSAVSNPDWRVTVYAR